MDKLPDPIKVSPFIRFARWSFLIFGIFYGSTKQKFLAAREVGIRREEQRKKVIRDAKLKEERRISSDRDVEMLGRMLVPESYILKPPPPVIVYVPAPGMTPSSSTPPQTTVETEKDIKQENDIKPNNSAQLQDDDDDEC